MDNQLLSAKDASAVAEEARKIVQEAIRDAQAYSGMTLEVYTAMATAQREAAYTLNHNQKKGHP